MDNVGAAQVNANELPEGFTMADPNNGGQPSAADLQKQQVQEQKQMILESACTQEALARLGRIKMVKPEKVAAIENGIVSMAMQGKLPGKINEGKLIEMLERGSVKGPGQASAGSISIQRKRYAFDSDDDDDDDEDLL